MKCTGHNAPPPPSLRINAVLLHCTAACAPCLGGTVPRPTPMRQGRRRPTDKKGGAEPQQCTCGGPCSRHSVTLRLLLVCGSETAEFVRSARARRWWCWWWWSGSPGWIAVRQLPAPIGLSPLPLVPSLAPSPSAGGGAHRPLTPSCPPPSPSALSSPPHTPFPSLGRSRQRSPRTVPVSLPRVGSTRRRATALAIGPRASKRTPPYRRRGNAPPQRVVVGVGGVMRLPIPTRDLASGTYHKRRGGWGVWNLRHDFWRACDRLSTDAQARWAQQKHNMNALVHTAPVPASWRDKLNALFPLCMKKARGYTPDGQKSVHQKMAQIKISFRKFHFSPSRNLGPGGGGGVRGGVPPLGSSAVLIHRTEAVQPPCMTFRLVVAPLRGPEQSPVLPFACCVGSLLSVGRCGRCSCGCRFRVRGAQ